jgi:hypothetical protein
MSDLETRINRWFDHIAEMTPENTKLVATWSW